MQLTFSGKKLLIAGGNCDIALELARKAILAKIYPILTYRNKAGNEKILEYLNDYSDKYTSVFFDLSKFSTMDISEQLKDIDFFVDFAQGNYESLIAAADIEKFKRYIDENITTRIEFIKRISRIMLKNKQGRMIFISSTAAERSNPGQGFYAAVKLASEAIYKNIGIELGEKGIHSMILRLGHLDCGRGKNFLNNRKAEIVQKSPIKRIIKISETVDTILYLLSESGSGFNAAIVTLDGGAIAVK